MARLPGFNSPGWRAWRCGKEGEGDKGVEARKERRSIDLFYRSSSSLHPMEMISRIAQVCATFGRATIKGGLRFRERGDAFCTSIEVYAG